MPSSDTRFRTPAPARTLDAWDGILLVDKPQGPTSHDIVDRIRRHFRLRKVGHGGTLDPQATGLLIILVGKGTKLSDRFMGSDKIYEGTIRLGITTDSQDADGKILAEKDPSGITRQQLEDAMAGFKGDIYQTPPMVSAVKIDGIPLYKQARKGREVEREPRLIHIYDFRLKEFTPPSGTFVVKCTKGTYVRTLCADIGEKLGCGAHLSQLCRTRSGEHSLADAATLDALLALQPEELLKRIIPLSTLLRQ